MSSLGYATQSTSKASCVIHTDRCALRDRIEHSIVCVGVVDQPLGRLIRDGRTREIRDRKSRGLCRRE